jgi:hypothetical protein
MPSAQVHPGHSSSAAESTYHKPDKTSCLPAQWQSQENQLDLLRQFLDHRGNLADFAFARGITIEQLCDWLDSPPTVARIERMKALADRQSELIARLARPDALKALADLVASHEATPAQRRLAAATLLRAGDKLSRPGNPSVHPEPSIQDASPPHPSARPAPPTPPDFPGRKETPEESPPVPQVSGSLPSDEPTAHEMLSRAPNPVYATAPVRPGIDGIVVVAN